MKTCIGCDRGLDLPQFTPAGQGPFCRACFEALCDPDLAMVLEAQVRRLEAKVTQLKADLTQADKRGHK